LLDESDADLLAKGKTRRHFGQINHINLQQAIRVPTWLAALLNRYDNAAFGPTLCATTTPNV
jgi:hypothetical protein